MGSINLVLIFIIVRERTLFNMDSEEASLFKAFSTLTPGQFRKMMRLGIWKTASSETVLTREGERCDHLYYVVAGEMKAEKQDRQFELDPDKFIGEIAFVMKTTPSATVTASAGSVYIEWKSGDLRRYMAKSQAFENALTALFNFDLAKKVSAATGR
jgi:CRP-like cAMP-binding protein